MSCRLARRALAASLLGLVVAVLAAPRSADAQEVTADDAGSLRVSPYFLLGFGGEVGEGFATADLDATVGLGVRLDAAVHDYVTVGGVFAWSTFAVDVAGIDRSHAIDVDAMVRGRYVVDAGSKPLEAYVVLPVGFSAFFPDDALQDDNELGWNLGLLFGATYFVKPNLGVFGELGYHRHTVKLDAAPDLEANQGRLHLGVVLVL